MGLIGVSVGVRDHLLEAFVEELSPSADRWAAWRASSYAVIEFVQKSGVWPVVACALGAVLFIAVDRDYYKQAIARDEQKITDLKVDNQALRRLIQLDIEHVHRGQLTPEQIEWLWQCALEHSTIHSKSE